MAETLPTLIGQAYPVRRAPVWSTIKQQSISGLRSRFSVWSYPQYRYEIEFSVLRQYGAYDELAQIIGFYNSCHGAADLFLFADPKDNTVVTQQFGIGNGTQKIFQLIRTFGGFVEPVFAPTQDANLHIYADAVEVDPGDYTIDGYGRVTFASAPAGAADLTWSGNFKWYCRFDEDQMETSQFMDPFWELGSLTFTTEKF